VLQTGVITITNVFTEQTNMNRTRITLIVAVIETADTEPDPVDVDIVEETGLRISAPMRLALAKCRPVIEARRVVGGAK
jgi:hypothetical protein